MSSGRAPPPPRRRPTGSGSPSSRAKWRAGLPPPRPSDTCWWGGGTGSTPTRILRECSRAAAIEAAAECRARGRPARAAPCSGHHPGGHGMPDAVGVRPEVDAECRARGRPAEAPGQAHDYRNVHISQCPTNDSERPIARPSIRPGTRGSRNGNTEGFLSPTCRHVIATGVLYLVSVGDTRTNIPPPRRGGGMLFV